MKRKTKKALAVRTASARGVCGCGSQAPLGTCKWGKPQLDMGPHCAACCCNPELAGWKPLRRKRARGGKRRRR